MLDWVLLGKTKRQKTAQNETWCRCFFLENTLPSAPDTALGEDSIFFLKCLCRVPNNFGTRQREELKNLHYFLKYLCRVPLWRHPSKRKFLKKIQKTSLPSVLFLALGKDPLCRVPCPGARQSFFLFLRYRTSTAHFWHTQKCWIESSSGKLKDRKQHRMKLDAGAFFLENTLPSAPDTALGKDSIFFFEMSLPSA